jgi:hypothetical protein
MRRRRTLITRPEAAPGGSESVDVRRVASDRSEEKIFFPERTRASRLGQALRVGSDDAQGGGAVRAGGTQAGVGQVEALGRDPAERAG